MSENFHWGILACPWSNTIGFIRIGFTNWDLWSFSQRDLFQDCSEEKSCTACHVSLFPILVLKFGPKKLNSMIFLENLQEFNLYLCIPIYSNFPQVSYLGMNPRRGWNPNLEESYLPEYSEYEAEFWTKCKSIFYLRPLKFLVREYSPISGYSDITKT